VATEQANAEVLVRDEQGNVIGKLVNGQVINEQGEVIGQVKDGKVIDMDGNVIAENVSVKAESIRPNRPIDTQQSYEIQFVDFISGGTAEDGIVPVTKVRKE
jgi:sporulation protein YlmC with PRC-barrel domain